LDVSAFLDMDRAERLYDTLGTMLQEMGEYNNKNETDGVTSKP
jgi:hypothetical protein